MERDERGPNEEVEQEPASREPEPEPAASSWSAEPESPQPADEGGESQPDYYAVLGVPTGSDRRTVAEAYDRLARELQPDVNAPPADPDRMRRVDEAFDFLDDTARRSEYDRARGITAVPEARRGFFADRGLLLAVALILAGIAAMAAAAVVLFADLSGDDEVAGPLVTTDSGLQYQDLKVGDGDTPQEGDQVTVHYVGMLEDGTVFDDSRENGAPFGFLLGQAAVIPGWDEGISTMREGGKRKLIIPPELAYGEEGFGDIIPSNATIIFEVELLDIKKGQGAVAPDSPPEVDGETVTTDSGLQYIEIEKGTGITPTAGQRVTVHYTGWLESNGSKFDSSLDSGQPLTFTIGQGDVIEGWDEGLSTMKVGGKRRLIVPADLGYGAEGYPPVIPANAVLIFDVELLDVR